MIKNNKFEIKLTKLNEARRIAKSLTPQFFKPIELRSLKEARDLMKVSSNRTERILDFSEKLLRLNSFDEDYKSRSVYSRSPEYSPGTPDSINMQTVLEIEEPQILPYIQENQAVEDHESYIDATINFSDMPDNQPHALVEKVNSILSTKNARKTHQNPITPTISNTITQKKSNKPITSTKSNVKKFNYPGKIFKTKKNELDLLKFFEEPTGKKKLTKSQERVLLNRLQGIQTKFSK
jgi:hypothetical protein